LLTRLLTTWVAITIGGIRMPVQRLHPIMVTAILQDSSDPSWATTAEQISVTKSRSPDVPGCSASPIPISHIRVGLSEVQQPIMPHESMMSGRWLLNITIRQRHQQPQLHLQQQRPHLLEHSLHGIWIKVRAQSMAAAAPSAPTIPLPTAMTRHAPSPLHPLESSELRTLKLNKHMTS